MITSDLESFGGGDDTPTKDLLFIINGTASPSVPTISPRCHAVAGAVFL